MKKIAAMHQFLLDTRNSGKGARKELKHVKRRKALERQALNISNGRAIMRKSKFPFLKSPAPLESF